MVDKLIFSAVPVCLSRTAIYIYLYKWITGNERESDFFQNYYFKDKKQLEQLIWCLYQVYLINKKIKVSFKMSYIYIHNIHTHSHTHTQQT